ncbi:MAG: 3'-5' exonuclease [Nanoarchaeota archaeon]|nr:3'-5' exonuclease [Nanoarchaeota archaeon]
MIVVDIETSGLDFNKCGIWQIGALELENPANTFLEEARIDDEDEILNDSQAKKKVLEVTGKTKEEFRDKSKQSQKQLLEHFFKWCENIKIKNFVCQNPQFDYSFIALVKAKKYGLLLTFPYRAFDLHSIAQLKHFEVKGGFLIKEDKSDMGLTNILEFCGMRDNRKEHNALEDAKLTAEAFSRLVYGKSLFPEYAEFPVPDYLKKE